MSEELPELPEWVQDLIAKAEERGYDKGYNDGRKETFFKVDKAVRSALEGNDPDRWY